MKRLAVAAQNVALVAAARLHAVGLYLWIRQIRVKRAERVLVQTLIEPVRKEIFFSSVQELLME